MGEASADPVSPPQVPDRVTSPVNVSIGFLLFTALAVLMSLNGVRSLANAFGAGAKPRDPNAQLTGVISVTAAGLVAAGYSMFRR